MKSALIYILCTFNWERSSGDWWERLEDKWEVLIIKKAAGGKDLERVKCLNNEFDLLKYFKIFLFK